MYEETGSNICQSFLNIAICEKISYSKGVRKSSHLKKGENMAVERKIYTIEPILEEKSIYQKYLILMNR